MVCESQSVFATDNESELDYQVEYPPGTSTVDDEWVWSGFSSTLREN